MTFPLEDEHVNGFFVIGFVMSGPVSLWIDGGLACFENNDIFFLSPNNIVSFREQKRVGVSFVVISHRFFESLVINFMRQIKYILFYNYVGVVKCLMPENTSAKIHRVIDEFRWTLKGGGDLALRNEYVVSLLINLLLIICRECVFEHNKIVPQDGSYDIYVSFLELLDENYKRCHRVDGYCKMLGVSSYQLRKCVTKYGLRQPSTLINCRIVVEARKMLRLTKMPVKAISLQLGFDDASNFVKLFKHIVGETPLQYRDTYRKNKS
ncbi:MAG: helix-turn-helix domain-containing protein [Muribaculaceae bacterium]